MRVRLHSQYLISCVYCLSFQFVCTHIVMTLQLSGNQNWDLTLFAFCLTPQLYDAFPWLMHHLPGPHQKVFAYNDFMHRLVMKEVQAHEKQNTGDPQDFIDFYLAQITKVSKYLFITLFLTWLQLPKDFYMHTLFV